MSISNKNLYFYFSLLLVICNLKKSNAQYGLEYKIVAYQEINNATDLCKNILPENMYFTIDTPMKLFGEEVDSFFIYKWDRLNLSLGKKGSKEFDMLVPLNSDLQKSKPTDNLPDFSISYKIEGELGNRVITVQWKNLIPAYLTKPSDNFNFQVVLYEKDQSVEYVFGKLPLDPYIFFIFGSQERLMSIYFMDDFTSLSDPIFKFIYALYDYAPVGNIIFGSYNQIGGYYENAEFSYLGGSLVVGSSFRFLYKPNEAKDLFDSSFIIYPNPSSDYIYLSWSNNEVDDITITDLMGKSYIAGKPADAIDVSNLPSGLYILNFSDGGKIIGSKTFVKK
jgi:Secretion system C-terminal sorting domain